MVGNHVAGQPDAPFQAARFQGRQGLVAAEVVGHGVIVQGVGRGDRLGVAHDLLDLLRGPGALPEADQPQRGEAPAGQPVELLGRNLIEAGEVAAVFFRQLVEPDVDRFGDQDDFRHPVGVGGKGLGLVEMKVGPELRNHRGPRPEAAHGLFLGHHVKGDQQALQQIRGQQVAPLFADGRHLAGQRIGGGLDGHPQQRQQRTAEQAGDRYFLQPAVEFRQRLAVRYALAQFPVVEQPVVVGCGGIAHLGGEDEQLDQGIPAVGRPVLAPEKTLRGRPVQDFRRRVVVHESVQDRRQAGQLHGLPVDAQAVGVGDAAVGLQESAGDGAENPVQQGQQVELGGADRTLGSFAGEIPGQLLHGTQQRGGGLAQQLQRQFELLPGPG